MFVSEFVAPSGGDSAHTAGRGTTTILLVEDDAAVRGATRRLLERLGYHVLEAGAAQAALDLAVVHRGGIDLVLTEVVMPDMTGRAIAGRIRAMRPEVAVLYMTGYCDDETIARHGLHEPGVAFVTKPFDATALSAAIRAVLERN